MKKIIVATMLLLAGCVTTKKPDLDIEKIHTQQQLDFALQMAEAQKNLAIKEHIIGQYSLFGMALFATGLAVLAFSPWHRTGGFVFIAGGAVSMASLWLFDSGWFPWIAGATAVTAIGLMIYNSISHSSTCPAECSEQKADESLPKT